MNSYSNKISSSRIDSAYYSKMVKSTISGFRPHELIVAPKLYRSKFSNIPESTYYKNLTRLVEQGEIARISKGVYTRIIKTRFGSVGASELDITKYYIENCSGLVVGYGLFNKMNLTTQISKNIEILSTKINETRKNVGNFSVRKLNFKLNEAVIPAIETMEILENIGKIEDINQNALIEYFKSIAHTFNEPTFEKVIESMKYKKRTIAYLKEILNAFEVPNRLNKYLSSLSDYNIPMKEAIDEAASR